MARPYVEYLETLAYTYEEMAYHGETYTAILRQARETAETVRLLWRLSGVGSGGLEEVRQLLERSEYEAARARLVEACKNMLVDYLGSRGFVEPVADKCPAPRAVELLERVREAAGPMYPVIAAIVEPVSRRASELFANLYAAAKRWNRLADSLSKLYTAAHILEKHGYASLGELVSSIREYAGLSQGFEEKYYAVTEVSEALYKAAKRVEEAEELAKQLGVLVETGNGLSGVARKLVERIDSAVEEAKRAVKTGIAAGNPRAAVKALEELGVAVERVADGLVRTATKVTSNSVRGVGEAVKILSTLRGREASDALTILAAYTAKTSSFRDVVEALAATLGVSNEYAARIIVEKCLEGVVECRVEV